MYTSSNLDQMLRPEVSAEVHNLPRTKSHQHTHGADSKPLDALVCALIRISQLDLTSSQVVQLGDNLRGNLADPLELCFHRLQLLAGLDGVPVLGVGADVDV
jgi:predicted RNase H-like nuclease